jgi:hypothetical protein
MREKLHRILSVLLLLAALQACSSAGEKKAVPPGPDLSQLAQHYRLIRQAEPLLRSGDLVLRTGNDFISLSLRLFSLKDQTYSHCGLALVENGKAYVYHAIGGEDDPGRPLQKDTFEAFCDPRNNLGFGIFRYDLPPEAHQQLMQAASQYYRRHTPFDMQFRLAGDDSLYCSEFVYNCLLKATGDSSYIPLTHIRDFVFVAVDNLFINAHCHPVFRAQY